PQIYTLSLHDALPICFQQRLVRAGVQPCVTAAELLEMQRTFGEVALAEVDDLDLAAGGRLQRCREVAGAPVVEIQAGDGIVRTRDRKSTRLNSSHVKI